MSIRVFRSITAVVMLILTTGTVAAQNDSNHGANLQSADIYGIRIGMTVQEVIDALRSRHPDVYYDFAGTNNPAGKVANANKDKMTTGVIGFFKPGGMVSWETIATRGQFQIYRSITKSSLDREINIEFTLPFGGTNTVVTRIEFLQRLDHGVQFDLDDFMQRTYGSSTDRDQLSLADPQPQFKQWIGEFWTVSSSSYGSVAIGRQREIGRYAGFRIYAQLDSRVLEDWKERFRQEALEREQQERENRPVAEDPF